jgi:putative nucleotidyltransferase-like protein
VSLFDEATALNQELGRLNISFAFLKGITLTPESVPDAVYRCQTDLDLLIRESDSAAVFAVLGKRGYRLFATSGQTYEFKAGQFGTGTVNDIYKARSDRSLDLHLLGKTVNGAKVTEDRLTRARLRSFQGAMLPALSPPDLFVQQAFHLFKHMCSEHTRAFWVLEFWRHVKARCDDVSFWRSVQMIAASEPQADIAIGAATLLASLTFGPFAPAELTYWSMDRLSPAICLWIQLYGRHILFSDSPRSKLYLLLREQLVHDPSGVRVARKRLIFPFHLPQRVTLGESGESISTRLSRYRTQARFALIRLWFHFTEGLRFAIESLRWQRRRMGVTQ